MLAAIFGAGVAFSIAEETSQGVGAAGLERSTQNVFCHYLQGTLLGNPEANDVRDFAVNKEDQIFFAHSF